MLFKTTNPELNIFGCSSRLRLLFKNRSIVKNNDHHSENDDTIKIPICFCKLRRERIMWLMRTRQRATCAFLWAFLRVTQTSLQLGMPRAVTWLHFNIFKGSWFFFFHKYIFRWTIGWTSTQLWTNLVKVEL